MSTTLQPLKYRFVAIYDDGTAFKQPSDDKSTSHVETAEWNPSSFRDVDMDRLEFFGIETDDGNSAVAVNMRTGLFFINGLEVQLHDQNDELGKLKLIYFREVRKDFIDGVEQEARITKYFVGWETVTGKKIKRTVGVE